MTRIINFENREISVPDDATDDEIRTIIEGSSAPAPVASQRDKVDWNGPFKNAPIEQMQPSMAENAINAIKLSLQATGRGLANVAAAPVDLPHAVTNLGINAANETGKFFGFDPQIPRADIPWLPPGQTQGESFQNYAGGIADAFGFDRVTPEEQTSGEQLLGKMQEFATASAVPGAIISKFAPAAKADIVAGTAKPSIGNTLVKPYLERPAAAIGRDAGAGAGAVVGDETTKEYVSDNPLARLVGSLVGGVGGSMVAGGVQSVPRVLDAARAKVRVDKNIPLNPETGKAYTQAQSNLAARATQTAASDAPTAATNLKANADELTNAGVPREAMPSSGNLSEDVGFGVLERGFRNRDPALFIERDQAVKGEAARRVDALRDPNADQSAVARGVESAERSLDMTRDAEALPLLKQAEASGAVVDAQPVADLIDAKLATAKRPPVRAALTEARKMLNVPGGDVLDTSVSGLYETRKAVNDVINGRGENPTGRYASKELIEVRDALDAAIEKVSPEFGQYLKKYRDASEPLDAYKPGTPAATLAEAKDVREVAEKILSRKWSGGKELDEIQSAIKGDPEAEGGLKAAFADVLTSRVTNTKTVDGSYEASYAALAKQFKANEDIISKVFSPAEMRDLRLAHKLLGYFKQGEMRATSGSDTAEKMLRMSKGDQVMSGPLGRSVELVMKHFYGNLEGGGIMRRFKLMVALLPTERHAAQEIAGMAFHNPEVAAYLLGKPLRNISAVPTNHGLRAAIAADIAARKDEKQKKGSNP